MKRGAAVATATSFSCAILAALYVIFSASPVKRVERPSPRLQNAAPTATVSKAVIRKRYTFSGRLSAASRPRSLPVEGVVTDVPVSNGQRVRPGMVLLEVNGRPVTALDLPFPLWRDLVAGTTGKDVAAVQRALSALGLYTGVVNGTFDETSQAAVRALYQQLGHVAVERAEDPPPGRRGDDRKAERTVVLPAAEVAAIGGGPWRVSLRDAEVGAVLDETAAPRLVASKTELTVKDGGELAALLADGRPRRISLVSDGAGRAGALVVSADRGDGLSRIGVRFRSRAPARGEVTGVATVRTTRRPVTCVPITALRPTADGTTVVRALIDGEPREIPVDVGIRGDRLVEVRGRGIVPGLTVELV